MADGEFQLIGIHHVVTLRCANSGLAGTVLVYKIAGALAHSGGSLNEVYNIATWVANRVATIGVSLGHTHVNVFVLSKNPNLIGISGAWNCANVHRSFSLRN